MGMRVIGGLYRHRNLVYPDNNAGIRPTKDRIREAFFSSISNELDGKVFLDLCAGCGSMGIEAISRGAKESLFVDNNKISVKYIDENIRTLKITNAKVYRYDVFEALERIKKENIKIDIIYLDPPYESPFYENVLNYIYNNDLLAEKSIVAFEANRKIETNNLWYSSLKEYHYGEITVTVMRK